MMPDIHQTSTNADGVSSMAPAGEIEIAPGESVSLEPGGLHAMLMRLQRPMAKGESFSLTLDFSDGGEIVVEVPILGIAARGPES
jgi:copper(I)-binding protein